MAKNSLTVDDLLATSSLVALRSGLAAMRATPSVADARRLATHAAHIAPPTHSLRLGIVHTYTSDLLDPWLEMAAAAAGMETKTYHAPYGLAVNEATPNSPLVRHEPDITLLMLRREDLHPNLARPLSGLADHARERLASEALAHLNNIVGMFRAQAVGHVVITLLPSPHAPSLGLFDAQAEGSEALWWGQFKARIGAYVRESVRSALFFDLDDLVNTIGRRNFYDHRFWYSARYPFSAEAACAFARKIVDIGTVLKQPKAKVIVLDADNTLWGGIIGEDGMDGIGIGPDYPGSAYLDFQRRLLDFQQRGFILAMCSKNNPQDVDQVLAEHPHQLLREEHFAARRVNWQPKTDNLIDLAHELNLGLDSFIFVDDSDHECAAVRHALPQVEVIQTPSRPIDIPYCLDHVARLEVLALTQEDLQKTQMYTQERRRREFSESMEQRGGDPRQYLTRLNMRMRICIDSEAHLTRLSQLTQKTNQFNLTTRRFGEQQMLDHMRSPEWIVADFSLEDVFGDSGIVGLAMFRQDSAHEATLDTFLMSCRVIGREAEAAFLNSLLDRLAKRGVTQVVSDFLPTKKNDLVKNFLPEQSFEMRADGRYVRSLRSVPPRPQADYPIVIEWAQAPSPDDLTPGTRPDRIDASISTAES